MPIKVFIRFIMCLLILLVVKHDIIYYKIKYLCLNVYTVCIVLNIQVVPHCIARTEKSWRKRMAFIR
jgi:hypothetical protein